MNGGEPIRNILGVQNPANPFEVLGLPVALVSDGDIVDALSRRMKVVAEHALSETPEGNEVRLALHAAAAQLLDKRIRSALYERAGITSERKPTMPVQPARALGPRAMMVVASEGGWNSRALRRLAMIAHAEGIPSAAIPDAILSIVGGVRPSLDESQSDERRGRRPRAAGSKVAQGSGGTLVIGGSVLGAIGVLLATWSVLSNRSSVDPLPPSQTAEAQPPVESSAEDLTGSAPPETTTAMEDGAASAAPVVEETPDWSAAIIGFRDARQAIDADAAYQVINGWSEIWTSADARSIGRTVAAIVDVVYAMEARQAERLCGMLGDAVRSREPAAAAVHAGVLTRLSVERSLPASIDNAVVASLVSTVGVSAGARGEPFARGAAAGLRYVAEPWRQTPPDSTTLAAWLGSLDTVTRLDEEIGLHLARSTLLDVVRDGADPLGNESLLKTVGQLSSRMKPASRSEDAALVVSVLGDSSISTRAASTVLNALGRQGVADPAGGTLGLAPTSSESERAALRTKLSEAWLGSVASSETSDLLAETIARHLRSGIGVTPSEQIADAVVSARLAAIVRRTLWGSAPSGGVEIERLRADIDPVLARSGTSGRALSSASQAWAVRYLEAERNIPVRISLLGELVQRAPELGTVAAEVVMGEAVHGSPARVRREAQSVIERAADQPSVINAALEILPTAPRVRSVGELVEAVSRSSLPSIDDPRWPFEARRALVDRLLASLASDGEGAKIDEMARLLHEQYEESLGSLGSADTATIEQCATGLVEDRLAEVRRIDLAGSSASRVDAVIRMLAGRRSLAEGSAMRFAAAQVAATELLAEIVRLEHPEFESEVAGVLDELGASRSTARSVFAQVAAAERASLRLWVMRLGETR